MKVRYEWIFSGYFKNIIKKCFFCSNWYIYRKNRLLSWVNTHLYAVWHKGKFYFFW